MGLKQGNKGVYVKVRLKLDSGMRACLCVAAHPPKFRDQQKIGTNEKMNARKNFVRVLESLELGDEFVVDMRQALDDLDDPPR